MHVIARRFDDAGFNEYLRRLAVEATSQIDDALDIVAQVFDHQRVGAFIYLNRAARRQHRFELLEHLFGDGVVHGDHANHGLTGLDERLVLGYVALTLLLDLGGRRNANDVVLPDLVVAP